MKKLLLLIALVLVAYFAWRWWHRAEVARRDAVFFDRVWIDHLPKSETDRFHVFGALTREPFGWLGQRSAWRGEWEVFRHESRGEGQLEILYPHDRTKARITFRAYKCNEPHFDFCLDVSGNKGARKYFSRRDWVVHSDGEAASLVDRIDRAAE